MKYKIGDKVLVGITKKNCFCWFNSHINNGNIDRFGEFEIIGIDEKNYLISLEGNSILPHWEIKEGHIAYYKGLNKEHIGHKAFMVVEEAIKRKPCSICWKGR